MSKKKKCEELDLYPIVMIIVLGLLATTVVSVLVSSFSIGEYKQKNVASVLCQEIELCGFKELIEDEQTLVIFCEKGSIVVEVKNFATKILLVRYTINSPQIEEGILL